MLAGPKKVVIYDKETVTAPDLGTNFYATEADVGQKTRAEVSIPQLSELNGYVDVSNYEGEVTTEFLANFDVVVFTDCYDIKSLITFNEFCRAQAKPIGFIWTGSLALYGWCFVDFGPIHVVFDKNGERCLSTIVTSISQEVKGLVTVTDDERHGFEDGDWIMFREVEGMTEVNNVKF